MCCFHFFLNQLRDILVADKNSIDKIGGISNYDILHRISPFRIRYWNIHSIYPMADLYALEVCGDRMTKVT